MNHKTIYLLLGPKGSGKTFIGTLIQDTFSIKFVRVEDWALKVKRGRNIGDDSYLREVFETIENGIRSELLEQDKVVFESTGLTEYFDHMLNRLRKEFKLVTIKVMAEEGLCLERVNTRDRSIHINVSDDEVRRINRLAVDKELPCDFSITNNIKTEKELLVELRKILSRK
ncbi:MAG: hypothetical protein R2819_06790 [Allomuricauda sp.]